MTKKSHARLERDAAKKNIDAQLKNNTAWDDINRIDQAATELFVNFAHIAQLCNNPALVPYFRDQEVIQRSRIIFANDLTRTSSEIARLRGLIRGRTGRASTTDEYMESIGIYQEYQALLEDISNVTRPTALLISEEVGYASQQLENAGNNMTPEQNPEITTDVEFKEVKND